MENLADVKAIIQDFFTITEVLQRILYFSCIFAGFRYKYRNTTILCTNIAEGGYHEVSGLRRNR
jgi:hypothetical protein